MTDDLRLPPQDLEAETGVLGAILMNPDAIDDVRDNLQGSDFYRTAHRLVFESMCRLADGGVPLDMITIGDELGERGQLQDVGGRAYIAELVHGTPTASNVNYHARIVKERAQARGLIKLARHVEQLAYASDVTGLMAEAEQVLFKLAHGNQGAGWKGMKDLLKAFTDKVDELYRRGQAITGVPTGFQALDLLTAGLQSSDLIVVAGRPSMGKTSLALAFAVAAAKSGVPVGISSLEMSAEQLIARMVGAQAGLDVHAFRTGRLHGNWHKLAQGVSVLEGLPIMVDDSPVRTIAQLRARARKLQRMNGLGLFIVDYLQLMEGERGESRQQEVSGMSRQSKALAKELNVPVIMLSQLSRKCEEREDKRPILADLRESGAIEQDADVVAFVYRDELYNVNTEHRGEAEIIVRKHRNGPLSTVRLGFIEQWAAFTELEVCTEQAQESA